jgi:CBS-domain-containing membrane protein
VIGGQVVCACAGLAVAAVLSGRDELTFPIAAALAVGLMLVTGTLHPPATTTALAVVIEHPSASFVISPVLVGAILLVTAATALERFRAGRRG